MKNFLNFLGQLLVVIIGTIIVVALVIAYFIIQAFNWVVFKVFKKEDFIPIDEWLDKHFKVDDEFEE